MRALVEYGRFDGGPWRRPQWIDAGTFVEHFRDVTTLEQCVEPQLVVLDGDGAAMPEHAARIMHGQVGMVTRLSLRNAREWASARGRLLYDCRHAASRENRGSIIAHSETRAFAVGWS